MEKKKVLIGSPVHQKPNILKEFINSLNCLEQKNLELNFIFIDDNENEASSQMLRNFLDSRPGMLFTAANPEKNQDTYDCDNITHYWKESLIWRVAKFKNLMIQRAIEYGYDYLFLLDSDLLLHPFTIQHLSSTGKDIISEIFWTAWVPANPELPNVWLYDQYDLSLRRREENLSPDEKYARQQAFLEQLKTPGVYEVGGLGACTLISRKALLTGISFDEIKNLTFWGEDRHFCVRAQALGLKLYVDTHYPAYHIYRESALAGVKEFKERRTTVDSWSKDKDKDAGISKMIFELTKPQTDPKPDPELKPKPRLTLSMIMRNEADRYLAKVLEEHRHYIDEAVIIDDGSTDNSVELCESILQGIPLHIIRNPVSRFSNEVELRKQQWKETVDRNPEWILNLDADEILENRFREEVGVLINHPDIDLYFFRLYDFWNETHYREDQYWQAHTIYRPFLVRYRQGFKDEWQETPQHCGRFPKNITILPRAFSDMRVKHLGWARPKDRQAKYERYQQLDSESRYGWQEQYESILDPNPELVEWKE